MQRINFRRLFAVVLAMVMLFTITVFSLDRYEVAHYDDIGIVFVEDLLDDPVFSDYLMCQLHAQFGEQFLINHDIANEVADRIYDTFPVSRSGEIIYPNSFGGLYFDSDGNLVLLTVGDYQFDRSQAYGLCAEITNTDNVRVRAVEFSYSELLHVFHAITAFAEENWADESCVIMYNFASVGIDTIGNRVDVALLDTSLPQLDLFRAEIVDHPALTFTHVKERASFDNECVQDSYRTSEELIQPFSTAANPGSTIRRGSTTGPGRSIGYRAWLGSTAGFVTAAHATSFNEPFFFGSRKIGYVSVRHNATDSAFVRLEPGMSVSDRNPSFSHIVSPVAQTNPRVGHVVTRISNGGRDSNPNHPIVSTGIILRAEQFIYLRGHGYAHVLQADYVSISGDSGGVVVTPASGIQIIAGIQSASTSNTSYFSHVSRINTALGVSLH